LFLAGERFVCLSVYFVLCDSDNDDVNSTSTTDVNCSPRWIVYPRLRTHGAVKYNAATLQQCLDTCVNNSRCRTAEWFYIQRRDGGCWLHERDVSHRRQPHADFVQFDIVRRCYTASGTWRHHTMFYIIKIIFLKIQQMIFKVLFSLYIFF